MRVEIALVLLVFIVVVISAGWMVKTARRLHLLHIRRDLSWQALLATLDRREWVARAISAALGPKGEELAQLVRSRDTSTDSGREEWESTISVCLSAVVYRESDSIPPFLLAEYDDCEARIHFAQSFYNEAVRDTLALQTRKEVRVCRLAGTAPLPQYFEMVDRRLDHEVD